MVRLKGLVLEGSNHLDGFNMLYNQFTLSLAFRCFNAFELEGHSLSAHASWCD